MILRLLANDGFLTVNKTMAREYGLDAAVLLAHLASVQVYWEDRDGLDSDGMFFATAESIQEATTLSRFKQRKAIGVLADNGILTTDRKGVPARQFFRINENILEQCVKNKSLNNLKTRVEEISKLDVKKFQNINKNKEIRLDKNKSNDVDAILKELPPELVDTIKAFLEHRKKLKSPMTATALELAVKKANKLAGGDTQIVKAIFEQSMLNGWKGVFPLTKEKEKSQRDALAEAWRELDDGLNGTGDM